MSVSWEHAYADCSPAAAGVLRAVVVLGLDTVSGPTIGVPAGLTSAETVDALAELERGGWLESVPGGHAVAGPAREWLAAKAPGLVNPDRAARIVDRFTACHAAAVDLEQHHPAEVATWLARYRAELLATIRACDRDGLREVGATLVRATWPAAELVPDPGWWAELAGAGEALAASAKDPALLADLLHRAALTFAGQGDRLRAEERWVRALAIIRRLRRDQGDAGHGELAAAVLAGLGGLYRSWGRLSKALDAYLGLVELRQAAGDPLPTAEALATVAWTMRDAGRPESAAEYLARADDALTSATEPGGSAEAVTGHAGILEEWGRALWEQGRHAAARRPWSRALAMLVDVDEQAADRVRALLATAAGDPLPVTTRDHGGGPGHGAAGPPNTSSSSGGMG